MTRRSLDSEWSSEIIDKHDDAMMIMIMMMMMIRGGFHILVLGFWAYGGFHDCDGVVDDDDGDVMIMMML